MGKRLFAFEMQAVERQIQGSEAGFPDFRPFSCRFAGFRTGVTGARCPDARKRWKGEGYSM